jgi:uncharacterized protein
MSSRSTRGPVRAAYLLGFASLALAACVLAPTTVAGSPAPTTSALAPMPEGAPRSPLAWADLTPATFAKAKAERRFIVLDGSAEWCHWCHVMEATTYHDPAVAELLAKHFIAVKVDVDSRPDIEERYSDWGWPATVIFSPDAEEIGKYRGYIAPADFVEILRDIVASSAGVVASAKIKTTPLAPSTGRLSDAELAFIERDTEQALDEYYDDEQGGWGRSQKVPIAADNSWALFRASQGDVVMKQRALFTLAQQAGVIDPVWGGVYQYSVGHDWTHPHFEKLMPFEAGGLENYATAYALTGDPRLLASAQAIRRYIDGFLLGKGGAFYASQDADLNAQDTTKPFLSGHELYALGDAARRERGVPRVDTHEYGHENGLAIAAYVSLYEATCKPSNAPPACDTAALATAEKAATHILATHLSPKGGIAHDADGAAHVLHLADNAAFGFALARLYGATHNTAYLDAAEKIAAFLQSDLIDPESGGFFASSNAHDTRARRPRGSACRVRECRREGARGYRPTGRNPRTWADDRRLPSGDRGREAPAAERDEALEALLVEAEQQVVRRGRLRAQNDGAVLVREVPVNQVGAVRLARARGEDGDVIAELDFTRHLVDESGLLHLGELRRMELERADVVERDACMPPLCPRPCGKSSVLLVEEDVGVARI